MLFVVRTNPIAATTTITPTVVTATTIPASTPSGIAANGPSSVRATGATKAAAESVSHFYWFENASPQGEMRGIYRQQWSNGQTAIGREIILHVLSLRDHPRDTAV